MIWGRKAGHGRLRDLSRAYPLKDGHECVSVSVPGGSSVVRQGLEMFALSPHLLTVLQAPWNVQRNLAPWNSGMASDVKLQRSHVLDIVWFHRIGCLASKNPSQILGHCALLLLLLVGLGTGTVVRYIWRSGPAGCNLTMLPEDQTKTSCAVGSLSYLVWIEILALTTEEDRNHSDRPSRKVEPDHFTKCRSNGSAVYTQEPRCYRGIHDQNGPLSSGVHTPYMRFSLDGYMTDVVARTTRHQI